MGEFRGLLPDGGLPSRAMQQVEEIVEGMDISSRPTVITTSTYRITAAGDYVAGADTTVTLDNGQSLPMQRGQAIVAIDVAGQLLYSDFINLAGPKPPSLSPGVLSATSTQTEITATVEGAADSESGLHGSPYRFSRDGGGTWTAWQAGTSFTFTGLTAGLAYQLRAEVRNAAGTSSVLSLEWSTQEDPNAWGTLFFDDFNDAADGSIAGRSIGTATWDKGNAKAQALFGQKGRLVSTITGIPQKRIDLTAKVTPTLFGSSLHVGLAWAGESDVWGEKNYYLASFSASATHSITHVTPAETSAPHVQTRVATADESTPKTPRGETTEVRASLSATGEIVMYVSGTEVLRYQIPDYVPVESNKMYISVGEGASVDDLAIRAA